MTAPLVSGRVRFDGVEPEFSNATVYIRLEDVSRADHASEIVSERTFSNVSNDAFGGGGLEFELEGPLPDETARYTVSVHVDMDTDGKVSRGDYITQESFPVLTFGNPDHRIVRVRRVS